jgi:hypothetical protein
MTDKPKVDHAAAKAWAEAIEQGRYHASDHNIARAYLERDAQLAKLRELEATILDGKGQCEFLDRENEKLRAAVKKVNDQAEHFERLWYLLGDDLAAMTAERDALKKALQDVVAISDRKHDVWDRAHAILSQAQGEKHD